MSTDERIAARRAALTKQRAERKDALDLPRTMTQRQVNEHIAETATLDKQIAAFDTAVQTWAALPPIDADTQWLTFLTTARKTIDAELLALPPRIRDKNELEQQQRLIWSIRLIDFGLGISTLGPVVSLAHAPVGQLMRESGYDVEPPGLRGPNGWRGSIKEVEQRIKDTTKRRTEAQAALDLLLRSDDEKAQQDNEDKAYREVMNTMRIKVSADGKSLVAFTLDYDELPVEEMTAAQRQAFERFEAAHFGRPREVVTV